MKLSKIWALLKQRKKVIVMQGSDCQWIGDGYAAYPIYGNFPEITESTAQMLLDVGDKAWNNFSYEVKSIQPFDESDVVKGEIMLEPVQMSLIFMCEELIPLTAGDYIFYIPERHVKPFADCSCTFYYRPKDKLIAVKEGMLLRGVINPVYCSTDVFTQTLKKMASLTERNSYFVRSGRSEEEFRSLLFGEDTEESEDDEQ